MNQTRTAVVGTLLAALALGAVSMLPANAEDAALANQLDPNAPEKDAKLIAEQQAVKVEDGKYLDKNGHPTYHITQDGKKVDWNTYAGYRSYHSDCHVCHGPDGMGSSYAPALKDSLKTLSYEEFYGIVAGGKQDVNSSDQKVMPAFAENKNVMCHIDDLYVYLKARASGALPRVRPSAKEDKTEAAKKTEKECQGS